MILRRVQGLSTFVFLAAAGAAGVACSGAVVVSEQSTGNGGGSTTGVAGSGAGQAGGAAGSAAGGVAGSAAGGAMGGAGGSADGGFGASAGDGGGLTGDCVAPPPIDGEPIAKVPDGVIADFAASSSPWTDVAVGPGGDGIVIWGGNGRVAARRYHQGQWAARERIVGPTSIIQGDFKVVAGPDGEVLIVYPEPAPDQSQALLCARAFETNSGWSAPFRVATTNEGWWQDPVAASPVLAMNAKGDAMLVWATGEKDTKGLFARRYVRGMGWADVESLSSDLAQLPAVVLRDDGTALVAWTDASALLARAYDPAAGWGPEEPIADNGWDVRLAAGASGATVALWQVDMGGKPTLQAATRSAGGGWSMPVALGDGDVSHEARLRTSDSGAGAAAWNSSGPNQCGLTGNVRRIGTDGAWSGNDSIPGLTDAPAALSSLSAAGAGNVAVAWEAIDPSTCDEKGVHLGWFAPAAMAWKTQALDPVGWANGGKVALAPDGRALVVWKRDNDTPLARWVEPPP